MNKKTAGAIGVGILLAVLVAWWLGLFNHEAPPPPYTPPIVATKPASNPFIATQPTAVNLRMAVAPPVLPPVPASESNPPPAVPQNSSSPQSASIGNVSQQARVKAITNNLRQLATAASQYMLDKGVTSATYYDLVGPETDKYIRSVNPVIGEDYTGILVSQSDTQVSIVAPDGTMVTFNL